MRGADQVALTLLAGCLLLLPGAAHAQDSGDPGDALKQEFKQPELKDQTDSWKMRGKPYEPTKQQLSTLIAFMSGDSFKPATADEFGEALDKRAEEIVGKEIKAEYAYLTYFNDDKSFDHEEWSRFLVEREWHFTGMVWQHKTFKSIQNRPLTFEEARPAYEVIARMKLMRATLKLYGVDLGVWEDVRPPQLPGQPQGKPGWGKGEREGRAREFGNRARMVLQYLREEFGFRKPER